MMEAREIICASQSRVVIAVHSVKVTPALATAMEMAALFGKSDGQTSKIEIWISSVRFEPSWSFT